MIGVTDPKVTLTPEQKAERYTPAKYMEMVSTVLGEIDLDPASCAKANEVIKAKKYYDLESNGLVQPWYGKVFVNPPYAEMLPWVSKLIDEYHNKEVEEAILLSNPSTDTTWFNHLCSASPYRCSPVFCYIQGRIKFLSPDKSVRVNQPRNPSMFTYLGKNKAKFYEVFSSVGNILKPIQCHSEVG
ncbi:MAG: hypothetical protein HY819_17335 [Acidobacteria bacterium]|nr:hypothetical protein [Acidobacteriota bacterium]